MSALVVTVDKTTQLAVPEPTCVIPTRGSPALPLRMNLSAMIKTFRASSACHYGQAGQRGQKKKGRPWLAVPYLYVSSCWAGNRECRIASAPPSGPLCRAVSAPRCCSSQSSGAARPCSDNGRKKIKIYAAVWSGCDEDATERKWTCTKLRRIFVFLAQISYLPLWEIRVSCR